MRNLLFALTGLCLAALSVSAVAGSAESLRDHLVENYPGFDLDSVEETPIPGVFEVVGGGDILYMTADGRYMLRGELLDLAADRNLTQDVRDGISHRRVGEIDAADMVVYTPEGGEARHTVTVFTDVTCPYCRTLHEDLLELLAAYPVEVRYLMYPRAGVDSGAADTLRDIWCADDPQQAMTDAKRGERVPARGSDCDPPVTEQYELGQRIGVSGTPYVLLDDDGPVFAGYRPGEQLLQILGLE